MQCLCFVGMVSGLAVAEVMLASVLDCMACGEMWCLRFVGMIRGLGCCGGDARFG